MALTHGDYNTYFDLLCAYFGTEPYWDWFDRSYERLLRGMRASYCEYAESVALHTDLCSPLATNPKWTKLLRVEKEALWSGGRALWHKLVEELQPDIVLLSIAGKYREFIEFECTKPWWLFHTVKRKNPYEIEVARFRLRSGKNVIFVWGRAAQTPFGLVSHERKREIGTHVRELHDAG